MLSIVCYRPYDGLQTQASVTDGAPSRTACRYITLGLWPQNTITLYRCCCYAAAVANIIALLLSLATPVQVSK